MKLRKIVLILIILAGCAQTTRFTLQYQDAIHTRTAVELPSLGEMINVSKRYLFETQYNQAPTKTIPVSLLNSSVLQALPNDLLSVVRLGHSTVLLKINGEYWLTDPVFSESLGPVYFMGPKRLHDVPISVADLPDITGVLISHNHYDHMDEKTIRGLQAKVKHFVVPLGNGHYLVDWGVKPQQIIELDWWQSKTLGEFTLTATPANHLSGRVLLDQNQALWSSWVIKHGATDIFFSGDSGYSDIFKQIGEQHGPFDLTILENGAYDKSWSNEHMHPEETVQAHLDLNGGALLPVHNSTFDLAFHPWNAPLEKMTHLAKSHNIHLLTPMIGAPYTLKKMQVKQSMMLEQQSYWWQSE